MPALKPVSPPAITNSPRAVGHDMTLLDQPIAVGFQNDQRPGPARISIRRELDGLGFVDAGWWPESDDLVAEVPALLDVLWGMGRDTSRISYNLSQWRPAPRRLRIAGRPVWLGGFRYQNPLLVNASEARNANRVEVLLIAPDTDPALAERLLGLASQPGNLDRPERMMELART